MRVLRSNGRNVLLKPIRTRAQVAGRGASVGREVARWDRSQLDTRIPPNRIHRTAERRSDPNLDQWPVPKCTSGTWEPVSGSESVQIGSELPVCE